MSLARDIADLASVATRLDTVGGSKLVRCRTEMFW